MGNPVDEYIESVTPAEKQAGLGDYARVAMHSAREMLGPRQVGRLGMEVGMVAGASALLGAAGKAVAAATKSSDFKKMLNVNPDLVQMHAENPGQFNQFYTSLRNLNPTFAADPVVAGSYLRQMSEYPSNAGQILVQSVGAAPRAPQNKMKDFSIGLDIADRAAPPSELDRYRLQEARAKALKAERGSYSDEEGY
jgi:hypothetical protein